VSDRHEARLLLSILRQHWDDADSLARVRAPDPEVFLSLARRCDVHPTVHALLQKEGRFDLVGPEVERRLHELRKKCRSDNLLLLARVEHALDLLLQSGIVPVALKGLDILHRFSVSFDERTLDDVDLLVHRKDLTRALAVLEEGGWKSPPEPEKTHWLRSSFEMPLTSPGPVGVAFEIHWGLGQERRYAVDSEAIIDRAVHLDVAGRGILRLEDHDAVAHLLMHHLQHYFDRRLKWALDLGRIVRQPGFDWRVVGQRLESWGGRAAGSMALLHLHKLFPEVFPSSVLEVLPASPWRRGLTWPLKSSHPLDLFRGTRGRGVQLFLAAVMLERPRDLVGYLLHRSIRDRHHGNEPAAS